MGLSITPVIFFALICFVSFTLWTCIISFTDSDLLPSYNIVGVQQYERLFSSARWWLTAKNAASFGAVLVFGCCALGYVLAALIDSVASTVRRFYVAVFMLPLSMSFVVSGVVWKWLLNPTTGLESMVRSLGVGNFRFDWLVNSGASIYAVALVGVWQQSGMCMILFLAGFRSIDPVILRASTLDGASVWRTHVQIIMPMLSHVFAINVALLSSLAIKSFDLVVTLTAGGPGFSSDVPARFVMEHIFERQELALGAAATCLMVLSIVMALVPYVYIIRRRSRCPT